MRIVQVGIYNLRSITRLEFKPGSNFDVLIGQNDSWKSTILYALKKFLSGDVKDRFEFGGQQGERSDLSVAPKNQLVLGTSQEIGEKEVGVLVQFEMDESDTAVSGDMKNAIYDGILTILKVDSAEWGAKTARYLVLTEEFENEDFQWLTSKNATALKDLMEGSYPDSLNFISNENGKWQPKITERIDALRKYAENQKFKKGMAFVDQKDVGDCVFWPEYLPLESHGKIDWSDKIIEKALEGISKREIEAFMKEPGYAVFFDWLSKEFEKASKIIQSKAQKLIPSITSFRAVPKPEITTKKEYLMEKIWIKKETHFDNQWDGTKRRLMVAILQAAREIEMWLSKSKDGESGTGGEYKKMTIWGLDEPELHLHPGAQRDFFFSLKDFTEVESDGSCQIFCSTHSTIFVDHASLGSVHVVNLDESGATNLCTMNSENGDITVVLKSLGVRNSDLFFANGFVVVEGATELSALPILFEHHFGRSMDDYGVQIVNAESCSKIPEKFRILFDNFHNSIALLDKDSEDETKDIVPTWMAMYIWSYDFEDAFDNAVWVSVLTDMAPETAWDNAVLNDDIRAKLWKESNKKFVKLLDSYRRNKNPEDRDKLESLFERKPSLWEALARKAVEMDAIPKDIKALFQLISIHLIEWEGTNESTAKADVWDGWMTE